MSKKIGNQTYKLETPVHIFGYSATVGAKESNGPLQKYFKNVEKDDTLGEATFEKAERKMMEKTIAKALKSCDLNESNLDFLIGGDLLNQLVTVNYTARNLSVPFLGIYGACSTMSESLAIGSMLLDGGFGDYIACVTGSHFATAERQYRNPLEFGNQRQTYSQWTVTGMGCTVLSHKGNGPKISMVCMGKVTDWGVKDIANMGAAMAPAGMSTLTSFFEDTNTLPEDYDLIVSGDLGKLGSDILKDLMEKAGYKLGKNYVDCGHLIYSNEQKALQGGSGAGCSACVFNSYLLNKIEQGTFKKILFMATGALMNTTVNQQGETIPAIAHLVVVERWGGKMTEALLMYLKVFLVGGAICLIGEVILITTKITTARILVIFLMAGAILGGFNLYGYLVDFAGAGATVPITGFGNALARGAILGGLTDGFFGALAGGLLSASLGISISIGASYLVALLSSSRTKKE